jgi:4-amino-4-deoxy-L-arabinose transferase-like glycosyltransferase
VHFSQVDDTAFPYFHAWAQSDMSFNDAWARDIVSGNVLGVPAPRPRHRWHGEVALEAHRLTGAREPFDDAWTRTAWARWLGDRSFYQDPLYPYAVAAVYAAGGGPREVLIVQSALGAAVAVMLAWTACLVWDARVGLLAGLMAALFAPLLFYEGMMVRAMPLAVALVAAVACAAAAARARGVRFWAAGGVSAGLAVLAYATSGLVVAGLAAWIAASVPPDARRRSLLAFAGGVALALLPLAARNAAAGLPLLETSSARAVNVITAMAVDAEPRTGFHISAHTARILVETGGRFLPVVRATLATHPGVGSVAAQAADKFLAFWEGREATDNVSFEYFLLQAPLVDAIGLRFALIAPLAVFGAVLERRRARSAAPLLIGAASAIAVAIVFFPSSRVRFPGALLMIPFAAAGLVSAVTLLRRREWKPLVPALAAAAVALVLVDAPWSRIRSDLREADYAVGNEIALGRIARAGDARARARIAEGQLRTEPEDLVALDPSRPRSTISARSARLAGSFASLHAAAAEARAALGDRARAEAHRRRAAILAYVAEQASRS